MKPMEGVRVVELATMLAGPMTARILAEWGADIIKVESLTGDVWREQYGTSLSPCTEAANPNYDVQNMNKRFVALNLRSGDGMAILHKLLAGADVFVTNYRIHTLEKMGLSYDQLKEKYPGLIYAGVLGYGAEGPDKYRPGYDYTAFSARTGLMGDLAPAGGPPIMTIAGLGDHSVVVALAGGISAALYQRTHTGKGDKVDVSLLQVGVFIMSTGVLNAFNGRQYPRDRYNCSHAGSNTYQGSDGEWFYLAVVDYRRFHELCDLLGMSELMADPRYNTLDAYYSVQSKRELTMILDEKFATQPVAYWHKLLSEYDLPHELVCHLKDVPYDEQAVANHYTYFHEYSDGTKSVFTNGPVHFASIDPASIPFHPSGEIGRDTDEVLKESGYTDEEVQRMRTAGEVK